MNIWFVSVWRRYTTLMQGLWALPPGEQVGLPSLLRVCVVDPVGPKCLQTAKCCGSGIQVQSYNSEELRRFRHLMTELYSRL